MDITIVNKALEMIKGVVNLSETVAKTADPEKYADSVNKLHEGVSNTYATMRDVILKSEQFSDAEKIEKLLILAEHEKNAKVDCGKMIENDRAKIGEVTSNVFDGIVNCAFRAIPNMAKQINEIASENVKGLSGKVPQILDGQVVPKSANED